MTKRPTDDQFDIAIGWLLCNEGEADGERIACEAVADWLKATINNKFIRKQAKKYGVPASVIKEAMRRRDAKEVST